MYLSKVPTSQSWYIDYKLTLVKKLKTVPAHSTSNIKAC